MSFENSLLQLITAYSLFGNTFQWGIFLSKRLVWNRNDLTRIKSVDWSLCGRGFYWKYFRTDVNTIFYTYILLEPKHYLIIKAMMPKILLFFLNFNFFITVPYIPFVEAIFERFEITYLNYLFCINVLKRFLASFKDTYLCESMVHGNQKLP